MITPCSSASRRPLCDAKLAEAATKPPVCSHTMTGAGCVGGGSLTQMFNFRQSSEPDGAPEFRFGQLGGGVVAGSTEGDHGAAACGGLQRRAPIGGAANGTPRKLQDAPLSIPCRSPPTVVTRHEGA